MPSPSTLGTSARPDEAAFHAHRFLLRTGLAIGNIFAWIFVFEYFALLAGSVPRAFAGVLLMYALSQIITIVLTPIAAAHLQHGTGRVIFSAIVLAASAYVVLGATLGGFFDEAPALWGIAVFAMLLGAYRALYFIPYELNRSEVERMPLRGRIFYELLLSLVPAFAGATLLMEAYAPLRLLFGAALLAGISLLPLFALANIRERFSFSYMETFAELFAPRNQRLVWVSFLEGVQGAALFLIWPLAIFLIVGWSYGMLGVVFSITLLLILLLRILYRNFVSSAHIKYSTPVHVVFAVSGWVARLAAGTPIGVIFADSYAYTARPLRGTLVDPFVFEQAADNGSYIDERTTLKEIALAFGRIALVAVVGFFAFSTPLVIAFAVAITLAAVASGCSVFVARQASLPAY